MKKDYDIIKDKYGEKMAKFCREKFPTILENEGMLSNFLLEKFHPTKELYDDIMRNNTMSFIGYINRHLKSSNDYLTSNKSVKELFDEAGYDFYECKSHKEVDSFSKYYDKDELLCTFGANRLNTHHVFFAVKKDVDSIKRKDFKIPDREDRYGTSVISVQFSRSSDHSLSIKNRYNHSVVNPDATFSNNLENIAVGLTSAFERDYHLVEKNPQDALALEGYVLGNDGKYYKSHCSDGNYYYGDNVVIDEDGNVTHINTASSVLIDNYVLDFENKKLYNFDSERSDRFNSDDIRKVELVKDKDKKTNTYQITFLNGEYRHIEVDKNNQIIGIVDNHLDNTGNKFLSSQSHLKNIRFDKVKSVGNGFLESCLELDTLSMSDCTEVGSGFLDICSKINNIDLYNVERVGNDFLSADTMLKEVNLPHLKYVGDNFMYSNVDLKTINAPMILEVGNNFLKTNRELENANFPEMEIVGNKFLATNRNLRYVNFPNMKRVGDDFIVNNSNIEVVKMEKLEDVGSYFLGGNKILRSLYLPNVKNVGEYFIHHNNIMEECILPNVENVSNNFLAANKSIKEIKYPKLETVGDYFFECNSIIDKVELDNVKVIGSNFLSDNTKLEKLVLPEVTSIGDAFLHKNEVLNEIDTPKLQNVGICFLFNNKSLTDMNTDNLENIGRSYFIENPVMKEKFDNKLKKVEDEKAKNRGFASFLRGYFTKKEKERNRDDDFWSKAA